MFKDITYKDSFIQFITTRPVYLFIYKKDSSQNGQRESLKKLTLLFQVRNSVYEIHLKLKLIVNYISI